MHALSQSSYTSHWIARTRLNLGCSMACIETPSVDDCFWTRKWWSFPTKFRAAHPNIGNQLLSHICHRPICIVCAPKPPYTTLCASPLQGIYVCFFFFDFWMGLWFIDRPLNLMAAGKTIRQEVWMSVSGVFLPFNKHCQLKLHKLPWLNGKVEQRIHASFGWKKPVVKM